MRQGRLLITGLRMFSGVPTGSALDLVEGAHGTSTLLTINRPKALNALDGPMCQGVKDLLLRWKRTPSEQPVVLIMKGEGGKAFCAGGDVKTVWQELQDLKKGSSSSEIGSGASGFVHSDFFRVEYEMNYLLGTSRVPQVSLWDGIVMGGGVGVSVLGRFRVATEKTLFAMPETAIGLFPDVGSSYWLPGLQPVGFGLYLGLSGVRLRASDLLQSGIATHYVSSSEIAELVASLGAVKEGDGVKQVLDDFHVRSIKSLDSSKAILPKHAQRISNVFGAARSVSHVFEMLQQQGACEWSQETLALMNKMSPSSMHVTYAQLQRGKGRSLQECLEMEFRLMMRCMAAPDFTEGIRAVLVDKDHNPRWQPAGVQDVSETMVSKYFEPLAPSNELKLSNL